MKRLLLCAMLVTAVLFIVYRPVYPTRKLGPAAAATIRKGKTSKPQVRALLGAPQSVERQVPIRQTPGTEPLPAKYTASEIWAYWTYGGHAGARGDHGAKRSRFSIVVYFDAQGTVLDCVTDLED